MSTIRRDGTKVVLPRMGGDEFWKQLQRHYAARDDRRWRQLAMLALREAADWPLEHIGFAFNHSPGHVHRTLERVKRELRERFRRESDEWPGGPDEHDERPANEPAGITGRNRRPVESRRGR